MTVLEIYNKYEAYIYTIAAKYTLPKSVDFEDLIQEGRLYLLEAANRIDSGLEVQNISVYIYNTLRRKLHLYTACQGHDLSVSTWLVIKSSQIDYNLRKYPDKKPKDFFKKLQIQSEAYKTIEDYNKIVFMSKDGEPGEYPLQSHYLTTEENFMHKSSEETVDRIFMELRQGLNQNQSEVLGLVLEGLSYTEIGSRRGVTRQQIGNVVFSCKNRLKKIIENNRNYREFLQAA